MGEMTETLIMSYTQHVCLTGGMSDSCYSLTVLQHQPATFKSCSASLKVVLSTQIPILHFLCATLHMQCFCPWVNALISTAE